MKVARLGQLTLVGLLVVFLAACAGKQVKESPAAAQEPVAQTAAPSTPAAAVPTVASNPAAVNPLVDPANILSKRSIYYDYDKYDIKPEFKPLIEAHAKYLRDHQGANVAIQGNTDERGSTEYNIALGQRRSAAVMNMMKLLGVPERQMEAISFGKEKPKALGHDEASWAQNRRSDIVYNKEQ
jgi:peptidoglycan-associated lipoprotein